MLPLPTLPVPIQKLITISGVDIYIKREDLVHPEVSGNKYWKLYYNINNYLENKPPKPHLLTFGGAYSNHIAATAAVGKMLNIPTTGIIRGEELAHRWQDNATLQYASENGMAFRFVPRSDYRDQVKLENELQQSLPESLIIPEGGTNAAAVEGFRHVLSSETDAFDYICTAVGTGGTIAGLSRFAAPHQKVLGFAVVKDSSLCDRVYVLSGRKNFEILEASWGGYGILNDEVTIFINRFYQDFGIPLDPVYTGKMMFGLMQNILAGNFKKGSRILALHTGGLQGIEGANRLLNKKNKQTIRF